MGEYISDDKPYYAYDWLRKIGLSAHALITPDGTVIRCRDDHQGAWHARDFNTNSLGIEFLVKGEHSYASFMEAIKYDYITPEQYQAGLAQIKEWIDLHSIHSIDRHSDLSPGRKADPGSGFPWAQLMDDVFNSDYTGVFQNV